MSRYRTFSPSRWNRTPFRDLSPQERLLCLTIELSPYSTAIPGVSACGRAALLEASRLDDATFDACLTRLIQQRVVLADADAGVFVSVAAIADVTPANPNVVTAQRRAFEELPDCEVTRAIDRAMREVLAAYGERNPVRLKKSPRLDSRAWLRAWDPTVDNRECSGNVRETLAERSVDGGSLYGEHSRTETETETETGTQRGTKIHPAPAGTPAEKERGPGGKRAWVAYDKGGRLQVPRWLHESFQRDAPDFDLITFYQRADAELERSGERVDNSKGDWLRASFRREAQLPPVEPMARKMLSTRVDPQVLTRDALQRRALKIREQDGCVHSPGCSSKAACVERLVSEFAAGTRKAS